LTTAKGLGWPARTPVPTASESLGRSVGLGWPGSDGDVPRGTSSVTSSVTSTDTSDGASGPVGPCAGPSVMDGSATGTAPGAPVVEPAVSPSERDGAASGVEPRTAVAARDRLSGQQATGSASPDSATQVEHARRRELGGGARAAFHRSPGVRVLAVANQKGGVGKTTSVVNLGAALAQNGVPTLVVDLDPQGNASTALGIEHPAGTPSVYDVLVEGAAMGDVLVTSTEFPLLQVVPATIDLAGAEIELVSMVARENRLRRALRAHLRTLRPGDSRPEVVLIDCPPSLGLITLNALVAARELLVPIQCEYYALEGLGQLVRTVEMVTQHLNETLEITAILLTMYDARTRLSGQVADEVRTHFADRVLRTVVPRSVRISEAPSYQQTVIGFDPTSSGALSYVEAARELAASRHAAPLSWLDAGAGVPTGGALG